MEDNDPFQSDPIEEPSPNDLQIPTSNLPDPSASFLSGPNHSLMHLIHALSMEEGVLEEQEEEAGSPVSLNLNQFQNSESNLHQLDPYSHSVHSSDDEEDQEATNEQGNIYLPPPSPLLPTNSRASTSNLDLASSIHAIYRPIAARRRAQTGEGGETVSNGIYSNQEAKSSISFFGSEHESIDSDHLVVEGTLGRSQRSNTVTTLNRQEILADKLEDIFGLDVREEVVAEFRCWLFRSVLLQGYMYLTTGHICFYAYLASKEGAIVRSGSLAARGVRTRVYHKHWFILKDSVLSWYPNSTDPYFPDGHIDLHYCTLVENSKNKDHFKVSTADKKWHFSADSEASRDEWVRTIKKVVFRCQNEGESVKISIPLETIIDIERSTNLEFAETIRVRVYDAEEGFSIDEYWLSYFVDLDMTLIKMQEVLEDFRKLHPISQHRPGVSPVHDTTSKSYHRLSAKVASSLATSTVNSGLSRNPSSGSSWLGSKLRILPNLERSNSSLNTITDKGGPSTPRPASPISSPLQNDLDSHTYPPDPAPGTPPKELIEPSKGWLTGIPILPTIGAIGSIPSSVTGWLKGGIPTKRPFVHSLNPGASFMKGRRILETVSSAGSADSNLFTEEVAVLEEDDGEKIEINDAAHDDKVRKLFGLGEKEEFIAGFSAHLFRGIPIYGKVYISTTYFCFKSAGILAKTKMILPLSDIVSISKHRSYRIGFSGLIVVIKGHEEIFFEMRSLEKRDECVEQLEKQMEFVHYQLEDSEERIPSTAERETQDLLSLVRASHARGEITKEEMLSAPHPISESSSASQPPIMFCSTSSDFITFRPEKSLKFTCLTIGSRGDVQPYVALCKGLIDQGHTCKIASHGEYRNWVEGHGIEFEEIGGDPAELMQLMIAHDFFTIAFMKEAVGRFRGWLDDLLETTWQACQGSDVLIESPSAIAGLHIAEALRIPYFRAFTMPWSRTRAYPHAFAVPDHKMGGGYNYMTYTMFDQIFWRATASQVNRWRKKTLGLGSTNLDIMQQHKIPFLYNFSPVIVPPPLDWRENIHVTGYWWLDNPDDSTQKKWEPPHDLLTFLETAKSKNKKIIFVGFGSIIIPDPAEMTRVITEAVEKAEVYAIVAKGWSDRASTKDDDPESILEKKEREAKEELMMKRDFIFNVKSIPHDWLFPRIHAAVHHGGAGTTGASLRAGLPTIIKPFFGDQWFYADRVGTLGIGSGVRNLNVENLSQAIITAVTDEKQIARAKLAGETIRKEDGVSTAIQCIYRDLEYARSLIPPIPIPKLAPKQIASTPNSEKSESPRRRSFAGVNSNEIITKTGSTKGGSSDESSSWDVLDERGSLSR